MHTQTAGAQATRFLLAHRDIDNSVIIVHTQDVQAGKPRRLFIDVRIEPAYGVPARAVAERIWERLKAADILRNGRHTPNLVAAAITSAPASEILKGRSCTFLDELKSPEIRLTLLTTFVTAALFTAGYYFLPESQKPTAWWTLAPFGVTGVAALILGIIQASKKVISWSII